MNTEKHAWDQGRAPLRHFVRRGVLVGFIKISGLFFVFVLHVLLARLVVDTGEYGTYAWGQSLLFMVGGMAAMGVPVAASRFVASLAAMGAEEAIPAVIRRAVVLLGLSTGVLVLSALGLWLFGQFRGAQYEVSSLVLAGLLYAPLFTFATLLSEIAKARQWLILAVLPLQVLRPILTALVALGIYWYAGNSLTGVLALTAVGTSLLVLVLAQGLVYRYRQRNLAAGGAETGRDISLYSAHRLFATALPIFSTRCAGLVIQYANVLLIGALSGPASAGIYFAAERLANLASLPKLVVSTINQPSLASAHALGDVSRLQAHTTQGAHGILWPTLLIGISLILFSGPLLSLFGREFSEGRTVLNLLLISHAVTALLGPVQDLLIMTNRQRFLVPVMIIAACLHVAALLLLVPAFGALGAASATILTSCASGLWLSLLARRETGIEATVFRRAPGPARLDG